MTDSTSTPSDFQTEARRQLADVEAGFVELGKDLDALHDVAADKVQTKIDEARAKARDRGDKLAAKRDKAKSAIEGKVAEVRSDIDAWRKNREIAKLTKRAERAEDYAANAFGLAIGSIAEAHEAVLDALQARLDLEVAREQS